MDFLRFKFYRLKRDNTQIYYKCSLPFYLAFLFPFPIGEITGKASCNIADIVIGPYHLHTRHLLAWSNMPGLYAEITMRLFE